MSGAERTTGRRAALSLLVRSARPHRAPLLTGSIATLGVVAMRLALPWPLRGLIETVFPSGSAGAILPAAEAAIDPVLRFCALYLVFSLGSGAFEWLQRVSMARVASGVAYDLRGAAVRAIDRSERRDAGAAADLLTRVIGDSARLKADLKGILVHLGQNGLLILAITVLFLVIAPTLGLLFLLAGLLAIAIGYWTVDEVAETTERQRRKESAYAASIQELVDDEDEAAAGEIGASGARKEVRTTKIIARATLFVHASVGATIATALWFGVRGVAAGTIAPGELFLFIAYAITIQRRAVMIGRQIARGGKLLTNAARLGELCAAKSVAPQPVRRLDSALRLERVKVKRPPTQIAGARLGPLDLTIPAGERLLVLGGRSAGKSTLLALLAGRIPARSGRIVWDGTEVTNDPSWLRASCAYLAEEPEFGRTPLRALLGIGAAPPDAARTALLESLGVARIVRGLRRGFDQRLPSSNLSPRERRLLMLGGVVGAEASLWLVDQPVESERARDRARLEALLAAAAGRTVVVALARPLAVDRFDRVLVLRRGKVAFSGTAQGWQSWRAQIRALRAGSAQ